MGTAARITPINLYTEVPSIIVATKRRVKRAAHWAELATILLLSAEIYRIL